MGNNNQFTNGTGGNERNASRGTKNINPTMKFNDEDMNEAKASLKLLKQKATTNTTNKFSGLSNNLGGLNSNLNINVPNTSHNYRKVFKPNLNSNENNEVMSKVTSQTQKHDNFPTKGVYPNSNSNTMKNNTMSSNSNNNNKFNYNSSKTNNVVESRINTNKINPVFQQPIMKKGSKFKIEEVIDDRPAFVEGSSNQQEIPNEDEIGDLHECNGCGRRFREEALQKHAKACKKVFQSKRKVFDAKKKRIIDSEHAMIMKQGEIEEKTNPKLKQIKLKKKDWKKKSEMLRNVAAVNKTGTDFMKKNSGNVVQITGKNKVPTSNYDDLTFCNSCGRKYNEDAYNKHLNHCEKKDRENKMKGKSNVNFNAAKPLTNNSRPNLNAKFTKK
jgi:hypothetical protein